MSSARKSVLITGCSDNGIGSALALTFQQQGYHVFATARNQEKMTKLRDLANVTLLTLDVVEPTHIRAAVEAVRKETGGTLSCLVNNAGQSRFMPVLDEDLQACRRLFEVNVWGALAVTQAFAPLVIAARGTIVFVTSVAGYVNVPYMGIYSSSKRCLELLADTLRLELSPFNVSVLSIVTGAIQTNGHSSAFHEWNLPPRSLYRPIEESIARRARGQDDGIERMDPMAYARKVVGEIVARGGARGKGKGKFWYGNLASQMWFASTFLPAAIVDDFMAKGSGLDVLARDML